MENTKKAADGQQAAQRLQEALEQLQKDVVKVEVWAGALTGFTQPIPEYQPNPDHVLKPTTAPTAAKPSDTHE